MIGKFLAIDLGSYSVKFIFAKITLQDIIVEKEMSLIRSEYASEESLFHQARQINPFEEYTPLILYPSQSVQFRVLGLPFNTEREIRAVLKSELEDVLPSVKEGFIHDFILLNQSEKQDDGQKKIFAAAVQKKNLADRIHGWEAQGIRPAFVGLDSYAQFNHLYTGGRQKPERHELILDWGYQKVGVTLVNTNQIYYIRSIPSGARDFNEIIAAELKIEEYEADRLRISLGEYLWQGKADSEFLKEKKLNASSLSKIQAHSKNILMHILKEIILTINSQKHGHETTRDSAELFQRIILLGGFSRQSGLKQLLERGLGSAVWRIDELDSLEGFFAANHDRYPFFSTYGLIRQISQQNIRFNFLQEEFAKLSSLTKSVSLRAPMLLGAAALLIFMLTFFVQAGLKETEVDKMRQELLARIKRYFPTVSVGTDPIRSVKSTIVALERQGRGKSTAASSQIKFIDLLRDLNQSLAGFKEIKMKTLIFTANGIKMEAMAQSYKEIDEVQEKLKTNFKKVEISNTRQSIREKGINFSINAKLE